jgi:hypothetical protein
MKVYHDFTHAVVPSNFWGAFRTLGLEFDMKREPSRLLFDEVKLRVSADFQGLWSVDFPSIICRADDMLFGWVGSTGLSKST